jgi:hypothetical protein
MVDVKLALGPNRTIGGRLGLVICALLVNETDGGTGTELDSTPVTGVGRVISPSEKR